MQHFYKTLSSSGDRFFYSVLLILSVLFSQPVNGQSVSAAADLNDGRWFHESQILSNGKVLVFGGNNNNTAASILRFSSSELYDQNTNTWTYTGNMNSARDLFASEILNNGKVLAIGGYDGTNELSTCELYDPATGLWTSTGSMLIARSEHESVILKNGKVLVVGGAYNSKAEIFDPITNIWSATGDMKMEHGRGISLALLSDGKVLATGGSEAPTNAEIYDPATGAWTLLAATTKRNRYFHKTLKLNNGFFLIIGSQSINSSDQLSAELYNPTTRTFALTGTPLVNIGVPAATLLDDGKVLVYGIGDLFTPTSIKSIQYYNSNVGTWSASSENFIGGNAATATLLSGGKILLTGGSFTVANAAYKMCKLVNQDIFTSCTVPNTSLSVTGYATCNGKSATVQIPVNESGVKYELMLGNNSLGTQYDGGSPLTISISSDQLGIGENVFKVKLVKSGCPAYFLSDTAVVINSLPSIPTPVITASGTTTLCSGNSVQLNAPVGMDRYKWSNSSTSQNILVSASGYFRVQVGDAQGCYTDYSNIIQVEAVPATINAGADQTICANASAVTLIGSPSGGTWSGTGVASDQFNPATSGAGSFTITYSLCNKTDTRIINVTALPVLNNFTVDLSDTVCYNGSSQILIYNAQSGANYAVWRNGVYWKTMTGTTPTLGDYVTSIQQETEFEVRATFSNSCGIDSVKKKVSVFIYVDPTLTVGTKNTTVCRTHPGILYIVKSQPGVKYILVNNFVDVSLPKLGNGDTLFFTTENLVKSTSFSFRAYKYSGLCNINLFQQVSFTVVGPSANFSLSTENPETNESVEFYSAPLNSSMLDWYIDGGSGPIYTNDLIPAPVLYTSVGVRSVKLVTTDMYGCKDSTTKIINVINPPENSDCAYTTVSSAYINALAAVATDKMDNSYLFMAGTNNMILNSPRGDTSRITYSPIQNMNSIQLLVKYNEKGSLNWVTYIRQNSASSVSRDIVSDSLGNVYVMFSISDVNDILRAYSVDGSYVTIDPPNYTGGGQYRYPIIIVKYDKDGFVQWYNAFLEYYTSNMLNLALDKNLNLYACSEGNVLKYNQSGILQWSKQGSFSDVAVDSGDNVWTLEKDRLLLNKYNASGTLLYTSVEPQKLGGGHQQIEGQYLMLDNSNNIYVGGEYHGKFIFNNDTLSDVYSGGSSNPDLFVCKLNSDGSYRWIESIQSSSEATLKGMILKGNKIVFNGYANSTFFRYNQRPDKTFEDSMETFLTTNFIGMIDTSANSKFVLKITQEYSSYNIDTDNMALLKQSGKLLIATEVASHYLGRPIQSKNTGIAQQGNLVLLQYDLDCLFGPNQLPVSIIKKPNIACLGDGIRFEDKSTENTTSRVWSFPGGTPSVSTDQNPVIVFPAQGFYEAYLTATNAVGTGNTMMVRFYANRSPIMTTTYPDSACQLSYVTLSATGANYYRWSNGSTYHSTTIQLTRDTMMSVVGTNYDGCTTTKHIQIKNLALSYPEILAQNTICFNADPIALEASLSGGFFYGDGISSGIFDPSDAGVGAHTINYIYTNASGCGTTVTREVTVSLCQSIEEASSDAGQLTFYPNPSNGFIALKNATDENGFYDLVLLSSEGNEVAHWSSKENEDILDISSFAKGFYYMKITNQLDTVAVVKIVLY